MKFTEKMRSVMRYCAAFVLIFGSVTVGERSEAVDGISPYETFGGDTLRCVINTGNENYGRNGFRTGFNYELLRKFGDHVGARMEISLADNHCDYEDSLQTGAIDIMVLPDTCSHFENKFIFSRKIDNAVWAVNSGDIAKIKEVNTWIATYTGSDDYKRTWAKYHRSVNPLTKFDRKTISSKISPYDQLIKEYAGKLGWDWRMLAAVIYQESKFSINTVSHRGATGLMQVMPSTARYYGIYDLLDPEENIKAGTMHLARLERLYRNEEMTDMERFKFVLASYNAGEGRIADCRNLAAARNLDDNRWDDILKVIPSMREDATLREVDLKFGKFNGTETMNYVENILNIYSAFCEICPA